MEDLTIEKDTASAILQEELAMYDAMRWRLTTRLRILNRVESEPEQRKGLMKELEMLEKIILEYQKELALFS